MQDRPSQGEHAAGESNPVSDLRRVQSGYTGRRERSTTYQDRREYMRAYQRAWMAKRRADYFAGKKCLDCGKTDGLELHHRDPSQKEHHAVWSWSSERREVEIAKCDVVCADCHKRRHGVVPGGRHGGRYRYGNGCRCDLCVRAQRERDRRKPSRQRSYRKRKAA